MGLGPPEVARRGEGGAAMDTLRGGDPIENPSPRPLISDHGRYRLLLSCVCNTAIKEQSSNHWQQSFCNLRTHWRSEAM
eukprot:5656795-Amphidinium_carterae.1